MLAAACLFIRRVGDLGGNDGGGTAAVGDGCCNRSRSPFPSSESTFVILLLSIISSKPWPPASLATSVVEVAGGNRK